MSWMRIWVTAPVSSRVNYTFIPKKYSAVNPIPIAATDVIAHINIIFQKLFAQCFFVSAKILNAKITKTATAAVAEIAIVRFENNTNGVINNAAVAKYDTPVANPIIGAFGVRSARAAK